MTWPRSCMCGDAQVAAVEIDGRTPDLLDEGLRQPPRQMLAPRFVDLAREALAQLLRGGGDGIEQPHDAPQVVALLRQLQRAAPAVEPHDLGDGDAVAERKTGDQEGAQIGAGALDDGERLRHGELQQRIAALRMQALGHHLDRLEAEAEHGIAARHAVGPHGGGEAHDVAPGLGLPRRPAGRRPGRVASASAAAALGSGTISRPLQVVDADHR